MNIVGDLWFILNLFFICLIVTATILVNVLMTMRMGFYFKSFRDPINAFKKEPTLADTLKTVQEQNEIAGNRL